MNIENRLFFEICFPDFPIDISQFIVFLRRERVFDGQSVVILKMQELCKSMTEINGVEFQLVSLNAGLFRAFESEKKSTKVSNFFHKLKFNRRDPSNRRFVR
jgi:hypothetical protein